jgi:inner membrane protein
LFAALAGSAIAWWAFRGEDLTKMKCGRASLMMFFVLAVASHLVLDSLTDGGLGVAAFAPFDDARYFAPWRPIRVSPIGAAFFSPRGLLVLASEIVWVWLPALALVLLTRLYRRQSRADGT